MQLVYGLLCKEPSSTRAQHDPVLALLLRAHTPTRRRLTRSNLSHILSLSLGSKRVKATEDLIHPPSPGFRVTLSSKGVKATEDLIHPPSPGFRVTLGSKEVKATQDHIQLPSPAHGGYYAPPTPGFPVTLGSKGVKTTEDPIHPPSPGFGVSLGS